MPIANTMSHAAVQQLIEQRLDVIDRALLGLLPRQDRLAAIAHIETRLHEVAAASPALAASQPAPPQGPALTDAAYSNMAMETLAFLPNPHFTGSGPGGMVPATPKKWSRLALSAGVLGILSLVLLLAVPVTYFTLEMLSEVLGEVVAIVLMGTHAVTVAIGGIAAVALGIAALVSLNRRREQLVGHGWAIAGLCTGPLPMLMGGAAVLVLGLQVGVAQFTSGSNVSVAGDGDSATESASPEETRPKARLAPAVASDYPECRPMPCRPMPVGHSNEYTPGVAARPAETGASGAVPTPRAAAVSPELEGAPRAYLEPQYEPQSSPRPARPVDSDPLPTSPAAPDNKPDIDCPAPR